MSTRAPKSALTGLLLIFGWAFPGSIAAETPLGSSFTYQGQLKQDGRPANGLYDLEFNLHLAAEKEPGTLIGTTVSCAVTVSNGLFTTLLDFGDVFGTDALWLEIGVASAGACDGSTSYEYLAPLQQLTATPFALAAVRAANADLLNSHAAADFFPITGGVLDGNLDITRTGTTPALKITKTDGGGEADLIFELGGNQVINYFDGSRLRWYRSPNDLMTLTTSGNLGIGTSTPTSRLHLVGNATPWTLRVEGSGQNLLLVDSGGATAPNDRVAQISNGAGTELVVMGNGSLGLGTGTPTAKLDVRGDMSFDGQKACLAESGTSKVMILVPSTWDEHTCKEFKDMVLGSAALYRRACIFRTKTSIAESQGTRPQFNCGW